MPARNPLTGFNQISATRIVATPDALDALVAAPPWDVDTLAFRLAPDELLITPPADNLALSDPHAIIIRDGSYAGLWLSAADASYFLERSCEWELPNARPAFTQGAVAGIPAKLWLETAHTLILVSAPYATEFAERLSEHLPTSSLNPLQ